MPKTPSSKPSFKAKPSQDSSSPSLNPPGKRSVARSSVLHPKKQQLPIFVDPRPSSPHQNPPSSQPLRAARVYKDTPRPTFHEKLLSPAARNPPSSPAVFKTPEKTQPPSVAFKALDGIPSSPASSSCYSPSPKKSWSGHVPLGLSDYIHAAASDVTHAADSKHLQLTAPETPDETQARCNRQTLRELRAQNHLSVEAPTDVGEKAKNIFTIKHATKLNRRSWHVVFEESTSPVLLLQVSKIRTKQHITPGTLIRVSGKPFYESGPICAYVQWGVIG